MNKDVDSKVNKHHDILQEKQMKEQIRNREETKMEVFKKKQQEADIKKNKNKNIGKLFNTKEAEQTSPDINSNVTNLKKMKKKPNDEPKIKEKEQNQSTDTAGIQEEKAVQQSNLKEMIDKLEDLKNKTNEWQKNSDSIVD